MSNIKVHQFVQPGVTVLEKTIHQFWNPSENEFKTAGWAGGRGAENLLSFFSRLKSLMSFLYWI